MKVTAEVFVGMEVNRKKKSPVLVSLIFVCMPVILYEEFNNIKHFKDNTHTTVFVIKMNGKHIYSHFK